MTVNKRLALIALSMVIAGCSTGRVPGPPGVDVPEPGRGAVSRSTPAPVPVNPSEPVRVSAIPDAQSPMVAETPQVHDSTADATVEPPAQSGNSAVTTLLARADSEWRAGNSDSAIAAAERALRIAPADPAVYLQLAELRLDRGEVAMAEQLARKGLSYQPEPRTRQRLLNVLEKAMSQKGRG